MKKWIPAFIILILTIMMFPGAAYAREGICGYEGGISSGEVPATTSTSTTSASSGKTYDYQEITFISGKPVILKGTLLIKKQQKADKPATSASTAKAAPATGAAVTTTPTTATTTTTITCTYTLNNTVEKATLSRNLVFETISTKRENGQTTETTALSPKIKPKETLNINGIAYTLKSTNGYDFTRSNLMDPKPAVNYHAGSIRSRKVYQIGAAANGDTVTVECTGKYYGYDQYWGNAESLLLDYTISSEKNGKTGGDKWGGTATVAISAVSSEQLEYEKNDPNQISFSGGYVQNRKNTNILEYTSILPEFDANGISTDNMLTSKDSLQIETFPVQKRLPTVNPASFSGHWAEDDIRLMFGLEVFKGSGANFKPDQYMSRTEFAVAMVQIVREVPPDPSLAAKTTSSASRTAKKTAEVSPYNDVSIDNAYYSQIKSAFTRNLLGGKGYNLFGPNDAISRADAMVAFVRALGFETLAPSPTAVTGFRDNDLIPAHARNAAYAAKKIGLLQADSKGNMNPTKKLTKAEGAVLFKSLITYLQDGIKKDYMERLVNY
jgi:N-acetylmuramoyl-L-alanine amidase